MGTPGPDLPDIGEAEPETRDVPEHPPEHAVLEFAGPEGGWPPAPRLYGETRPVVAHPLPGLLTREEEASIREAATNHRRVQELLGSRYSHVDSQQIHVKGQMWDAASPPRVILTFFSHEYNHAVEVEMIGTDLERASADSDRQPPEGGQEIADAIELAAAHPALHGKVRGLHADALLLPNEPGEPGYGHRTLWVTFSETEETDEIRYSAAVDLIDRRVLMVREEPPVDQA